MFDDADKWVEARELEDMGISPHAIYYHTQTKRDWTARMTERTGRNAPRKLIEIASLPRDLRLKIENRRSKMEDRSSSVNPQSSRETALTAALIRFSPAEREAWMAEVTRLASLIERYAAISPKRVHLDCAAISASAALKSKYAPAPAVLGLMAEAACTDQTLIAREPSRAVAPSQSTLDRWLTEYRAKGAVCFLRTATKAVRADDKRKAAMSPEAMQWVNYHWRQFRGPRHLYKALKKRAKKERWTIPSEGWFAKRWKTMPGIVLVSHTAGKKAYTDKLAPYVPRTVADLEALQVLCGDHSERDLHVLLKDGRTLARPWLTLWQDMRTGLLWGRHLALTPSSQTIGAAYANGVKKFGAQPLPRPDRDFYSYLYTDQGRDYKSHHIDGSIADVHRLAAKIEGGFALMLQGRDTGLLADLQIKRILARGYNAKEKPVERTHRDISDWEANTFQEWCGRDAKNKPDRWRDLWAQHQRLLKNKGKLDASPFIGWDEYLEALDGWIHEYNTEAHKRTTLNGAMIVPLDDYRRLYPPFANTISEETLALLLMKQETREIGKDGVELFGFHYLHPAMTPYKGTKVDGKKIKIEVRYDDDDYSRVWAILPDGVICEAEMLERSGVLNPNRETLKRVAVQAAHEHKVIKEHGLLSFSMARGLTAADRVAEQIAEEEPAVIEAIAADGGGGATVHRLTRMDKPKLRAVTSHPSSVAGPIEADDSIFGIGDSGTGRVREFDYED